MSPNFDPPSNEQYRAAKRSIWHLYERGFLDENEATTRLLTVDRLARGRRQGLAGMEPSMRVLLSAPQPEATGERSRERGAGQRADYAA